MTDLIKLTIAQSHKLLKERKLSSAELTQAHLDRIEKLEPEIKAFMTVCQESALAQAKAADEAIKQGHIRPLTGIPMALKDVLCTKGIRTTCSSKMLENFVPPYNAHVVDKLAEEGAVLLGKTNMDEFAMGSSTENSAFFTTHNPWNTAKVPGGSSGGSAACVAASEAVFSLGSDTGGSIRQPASFCSVTGLKPSYGMVSRYGLVAFASSLDQIGPFTKDVLDCALVMNAIAGFDDRDSTSVPQTVPDFSSCLDGDIKGFKLGVPKEYFSQNMRTDIAEKINDALGVLSGLGASVDREVSLPHTPYALAVYYILAPSEASANLSRYDGVKYGYSYNQTENMWEAMEKTRAKGFGPEVKRRIMIGTYALSAGYYDAWYVKAQKVRTLISQEFNNAFEKYDALITPTTPNLPFSIGEKLSDPFEMYMCDTCTIPINIAGLPAISIPAGFVDGLPVGLQIIGKPFADQTIMRIAHAFQCATAWHKETPRL
ncbi:MAG: glutamyl-tRNA(Gln) amidotransferase, A subunit [Dehalococcoides mccartyi]|uniref:Asp-tRNA(Asn)/Glu-tRNA(Gln) amidotransferase subunit GatA n=1 Tax=Dehalococcoides mccartyi TaxID=61435 RepID=UPI00098FDE4D|nr:Asp-tRNA(Asn)/Glu-tRNA(Gln) amidotransferase subunit GatA [Dehalococcoides mccartyi]AQU03561.1 aspartyl/glutamyl-tRNA amidotransferase subunit A [Dehalococcoides mccartyi]AQU04861.1 aspartyl/glutamyl-tRNA amidotransferase subunit A [Dehalococcoides mccartyi]MCF7635743.1 glutamyl-tRNA(Gln) amidotransferase, A subunit [Dehalococcoides mccartyi]MEA2121135.1 Glutamyl-tRNA(Gln) amidotransferase subunit A [Dehalococcoides mccartyi]